MQLTRALEHLVGSAFGCQLGRYVLVGGVAFLADLCTFVFCLAHLELHYLVAATVGFLVGSVTCYVLSVRWVFDQRRFESRIVELGCFVSVGIAALGINSVVIWWLVEAAGATPTASKLIATAFVTLFNFGVRRVWIFSTTGIRHAIRHLAPVEAK